MSFVATPTMPRKDFPVGRSASIKSFKFVFVFPPLAILYSNDTERTRKLVLLFKEGVQTQLGAAS